MSLELELLIAAWDNYKKNGVKEETPEKILTLVSKIDEGMIELMDQEETA